MDAEEVGPVSHVLLGSSQHVSSRLSCDTSAHGPLTDPLTVELRTLPAPQFPKTWA